MRGAIRGVALCSALAMSGANAGIDQVKIDMLTRYPLPLRWDNVVGGPQWVAGVQPVHTGVGHWRDAFRGDEHARKASEAPETGMSLVRLAPGQSVTVWAPAGEGLRVYRPGGHLISADLEFGMSDGSGLYVSVTAHPSVWAQSLILMPDWPDERLIRVSRPTSATDPVEVALFISRRDALPHIAPYRRLVKPLESVGSVGSVGSGDTASLRPGEEPAAQRERPKAQSATREVHLRADDEPTSQPFWRLEAQPATRFQVRGPVRLALEHRLRYPPPETETRQGYRVYARLDGRPWQVLEFVSGLDTRQAVWVDHCAESLGRAQTGYLEIPDGQHELMLESTHPLYARLLAQAVPDYLLPSLNAPTLTAVQARDLHPVEHGSIWDLGPAQLARPLNQLTLAEEERTALRLGRDNTYRNGGLIAAMALRRSALAHREDPTLTNGARDLAGKFTFYRNLLPAGKPSTTPQRVVWSSEPQLLALEDRARARVIAQRFDESLLDALSKSYFIELPAGGELEYQLPERDGPGLLRLAVDTPELTAANTFWIRYDDQPWQPLHVVAPELAERSFLPGVGETAVAVLGRQHGQAAATTLTAPFAALHSPAPLVRTAMVETPLPADARRVRLHGGDRPLPVALQYSASRTYALSEAEYLEAARRLGPEPVFGQFKELLHAAFEIQEHPTPPATPTIEARDAHLELDNHWLPLTRWLRELAKRQIGTLVRDPSGPAPTAAPTTASRARRAEDAGAALPAIELWSQLARAPTAPLRAAALSGQTRTLGRLNEESMAELLLRGAIRHETDAGVRDWAVAELLRRYRAAGDEDNLLTLTALAAAQNSQPQRLRDWVSVLLEQNEPHYALMVALAMPPADWPAADVARAAYVLGWTRVLDLAIERLPDAAQQALWRGYRAQRLGDYPGAEASWRKAGAPGQALAQALTQGLAIRRRLASGGDATTRERAVTDWNQWRMHHPGPWVWQLADDLIEDHAGTLQLYSAERNLYAQGYRAETQRPLRLAVYGPTRVRIRARVVHPAGTPLDTPPVDDWLLVRDGDHVERMPMTDDRPSQNFTIVGGAGVPGREVDLDYSVGAGLHLLEVTGRQRPLVAEVDSWRPEEPLLVLPELTPLAVAAAVLTHNEQRAPTVDPGPACGETGEHTSPHDPLAHTLLPVRTIAECRVDNPRLPITAPPRPQDALVRPTLLRLSALEPRGLTWPLPPPTPEQELRARLIALLWEVEEDPSRLAPQLPHAEQAVAAQPGVPGVEALMRRMRARADWEPVASITQSAGLRAMQLLGWQPETPSLRVRSALATPVSPDEQVLAGTEQLGLLIANPTPSHLRIELQTTDVRYLPAQPLTVWQRLDDRPEQRLTLSPAAPTGALALDIPPGQHVLHLGIVAPLANQFLRVRVAEQRDGATRPVTGDLKRYFHVATAAEPLRLRVEGPAWTRIDEWRDGSLDTRYRYFGDGVHDLELKPAPGQTEALLRVHRQVVRAVARETSPPRVVQVVPGVIATAPVTVPTAVVPQRLATLDRYPLGNQQRGTWSVGTTFAHALPNPGQSQYGGAVLVPAVPAVPPQGPFAAAQAAAAAAAAACGNQGGAACAMQNLVPLAQRTAPIPDNYVELFGTWRKHVPWRNDYYQVDILERTHEHGSPTIGARLYWHHQTDWQQVSFRLGWEGYAQQSRAMGWNSTVLGEITQTRELGPKTAHRPSLSFFNTVLQQQRGWVYRPGYIDDDVFSPFKYFHPRGLVLADTLTHRPWLDTLWQFSAGVTSDEKWNLFDPEQAGAKVAWKQLFGELEAELAYQYVHYVGQGHHNWNRTQSAQRDALLGNLNWDHTWGGKGMLRANLALQYSLYFRQLGAWLSFEWFPDHGRGYRDFRPGQVEFRDLRERRLPLDFNDQLDGTPDLIIPK